MKFGQVRKYNMRNIFIEKSNTKCAGEPIPISYSKKLNLTISLYQSTKVLGYLFLLNAKLRAIKIY